MGNTKFDFALPASFHKSCYCRATRDATLVRNQSQTVVFRRKAIERIWFDTTVAWQLHEL